MRTMIQVIGYSFQVTVISFTTEWTFEMSVLLYKDVIVLAFIPVRWFYNPITITLCWCRASKTKDTNKLNVRSPPFLSLSLYFHIKACNLYTLGPSLQNKNMVAAGVYCDRERFLLLYMVNWHILSKLVYEKVNTMSFREKGLPRALIFIPFHKLQFNTYLQFTFNWPYSLHWMCWYR